MAGEVLMNVFLDEVLDVDVAGRIDVLVASGLAKSYHR